VLGPNVATLWISTPSASDVQARVIDFTRHYGVVLLGPGDVPSLLAKAVVATEDERFYTHHGIDSIGLARALIYDASNRCLCQGGSTITEQLVKEVYLNGSDRGYNKMVDIVLALKVEGVLTKQQVMADYLSVITTGFGRRGVSAAACAYFQSDTSHRPRRSRPTPSPCWSRAYSRIRPAPDPRLAYPAHAIGDVASNPAFMVS
jgi:hypothetical protein